MSHKIDFEVIASLDDFFYSEKFISLVAGPVGCVHGDTLVVTEAGAIPISRIDHTMRVLSWNAATGRYQLSLSGGSFPKGTDYLYRVVTRQGEFDAAGSHRLLCAGGEYRKVEELRVGDVLAACSHDPVPYGSGAFPSVFPVDEPHYSEIDAGSLGSYAALARRSGQPFLQEAGNDRASALKRAGVQISSLFSSFRRSLHTGALQALSPLRNRYGLFAAQSCTQYSAFQVEHHSSGAGDRGATIFSVRGGGLSLKQKLSLWKSALHRKARVLRLQVSSLLFPQCSSSYGVSDRAIVSVTRKQVKETYWDMSVAGTHNYVTVDGAIHHNSTKTTAGIMKILHHASRMAPCADGVRRSRAVWVRNTREQLRDTSIPDFLKWLPDGVTGVFLKTEYKYLLRVGDVDCEVLFRGLDDANDVRRLLSLQASFFIFDEFREIHPDIYNTAQGRLGRYPDKMMNGVGCVTDDGKPNAHLWGMTNPPDQDTFWEDLLTNPPDNVHVTIQPSGLSPEADWTQFLPEDYYDNLAQGKTPDWIDVYIHAKFGKSLSGQPVFRSFDRATHVAKEPLALMSTATPLIIGVDAGLTPAAVIGQTLYDGRLAMYNALVSDGMGALRFIRERLKPLLVNKFPRHKYIVIIDPAAFQRAQTDERTVADIYKAEGFVVKPAKTNSIAARLSAVDKFLTRTVDGKPGVLLCPEGCRPLIQALAGKYRYKVNTKGERDETPEKSHPWSDVADAAEYVCLHADGGETFGAHMTTRRVVKPAPFRWAT